MDGIELEKRGAIYFEKIRTGLSEYHSEIKKLSQTEAMDILEKMWKESYKDQTYVDFYYYKLEEEARQKVEGLLTREELDNLKHQKPGLIFPLDVMLLSIITKLNEAEMLFSTIYFAGEKGKRGTWWGNYNQEYIVFTDWGDGDEAIYQEE